MRGNAVRRALKVKCRFSRETIISVESGKTHAVLPDSLFPPRHLRRQGARRQPPRHKDSPHQKHIPHAAYTRRSRSATTFPKTRDRTSTTRTHQIPSLNAPSCQTETPPHDAPPTSSLITTHPPFPAKQSSAAHRNSTSQKQQGKPPQTHTATKAMQNHTFCRYF